MKQHVGGPPVVSGNEESHRERSEDTHTYLMITGTERSDLQINRVASM